MSKVPQLPSAHNSQPSQILDMSEPAPSLDCQQGDDTYSLGRYDSSAQQAVPCGTSLDIINISDGQDLSSEAFDASMAPTYIGPRSAGVLPDLTNSTDNMPVYIRSLLDNTTGPGLGQTGTNNDTPPTPNISAPAAISDCAYVDGPTANDADPASPSSGQNIYPNFIPEASSAHHDEPLPGTANERLARTYTFYPTNGFFFFSGPSFPGMRVDVNIVVAENALGLTFMDPGAGSESQMNGNGWSGYQPTAEFHPVGADAHTVVVPQGLDSDNDGSGSTQREAAPTQFEHDYSFYAA